MGVTVMVAVELLLSELPQALVPCTIMVPLPVVPAKVAVTDAEVLGLVENVGAVPPKPDEDHV